MISEFGICVCVSSIFLRLLLVIIEVFIDELIGLLIDYNDCYSTIACNMFSFKHKNVEIT